jgi:broad specificity phosphatase PhoE
MSTLWFVRHGRTAWNDQRRVQGNTSVGLTSEGRKQIKSLLPLIKGWGPQALYSSPLARATESAQIIADAVSLTVTKLPNLIELDVGDWLGKTEDELRVFKSWMTYQRNPTLAAPPHGESIRHLSKRVVSAIDKLLESKQGKVLIVSHGDVIRAAICHYVGIPLSHIHNFRVGLGSLSVVSWHDNTASLLKLNHSGQWREEEADG